MVKNMRNIKNLQLAEVVVNRLFLSLSFSYSVAALALAYLDFHYPYLSLSNKLLAYCAFYSSCPTRPYNEKYTAKIFSE